MALWGSGVCLHFLFLLLVIMLISYASSSTLTPLHIHQLAISLHLIFIGALSQTEKYVEQVEKSFL